MTGCEAYQAVSIGLLIALPGLAMAMVADRVPPNPLIGFRVGYAYTSRRAWVAANRAAGLGLAVLGLASALVGLAGGMVAEAVFLVAASVPLLAGLVAYAERVAERSLLSEPAPPGPPAADIPGPRCPAAAAGAPLAALALGVLAAARLLSWGLPGAALALAASPLAAVYAAWLAFARPGVYYRPWLGPEGSSLLACLVPVSAGLVSAAPALAVLGLGWAGLLAGAAGLAAALAAAWVAVRGFTGSRGARGAARR